MNSNSSLVFWAKGGSLTLSSRKASHEENIKTDATPTFFWQNCSENQCHLEQQQVFWDPLDRLKEQRVKGGFGLVSYDVTLVVANWSVGGEHEQMRAADGGFQVAAFYNYCVWGSLQSWSHLQKSRRLGGAGGQHGDDGQTVWKFFQVRHVEVQEITLKQRKPSYFWIKSCSSPLLCQRWSMCPHIFVF